MDLIDEVGLAQVHSVVYTVEKAIDYNISPDIRCQGSLWSSSRLGCPANTVGAPSLFDLSPAPRATRDPSVPQHTRVSQVLYSLYHGENNTLILYIYLNLCSISILTHAHWSIGPYVVSGVHLCKGRVFESQIRHSFECILYGFNLAAGHESGHGLRAYRFCVWISVR